LNIRSRAPSRAKENSVLSDGLWVVTGQAVSMVALLAGTRAITEFVDPVVYGRVNLLQNLVVLLRSSGFSPLLNAGYRYYSEAAREQRVAALRALISKDLVRLMIGGVMLLAVLLLAWLGYSSATLVTTGVLALVLAADVARNLEITLLSAARRQRLVALLAIVESCARPALVVLLAWRFGSSSTVILVALLGSLLLPVLIGRLRRTAEEPGLAPGTDLVAGMRRYAWQLAPYGALTWVISVSDRYLIEWFSPDRADVGIYSAGYALVSQPFIILTGILAATLRPVWFSAASNSDATTAARTFRLWLMLATVGAGLGVALTWGLAPWATRTLLAPQYGAAARLMPWIAAGYFFYSIQQVLENHLLAMKRGLEVLLAGAVAATLAIAVTAPLVYHFGMMGAAYACPIYFGGHCLACAALAGVSRPAPGGGAP
jgi:O-antigen/teichoic acid export membrane protein